MGKEFPKIADEILGEHEVDNAWYWCVNAMVRADQQGQGIAKAMFELAYEKVSFLMAAGLRVRSRRVHSRCIQAAQYGKPIGLSTTNVVNVST